MEDDFTILEKPAKFAEMFADKNIPRVQVFTKVDNTEGYDIVFSGAFKWENNEIISIDGDSYNKNMAVLKYEWDEDDEKESDYEILNILVVNDW